MSWTDCYPVFTDEMAEAYDLEATGRETSLLDELFQVKQVINPRVTPHVVVLSLSGKRPGIVPGAARLYSPLDDPSADRELWETAVSENLHCLSALESRFDGICVRIYLGPTLDFLVPGFIDAGFEIRLMHSQTDVFSLSRLWAFLALEEENRLVTRTSFNNLQNVNFDVARTVAMSEAGLQAWRRPSARSSARHGPSYFPLSRRSFGGVGGLPILQLLKSFAWHSMKRTLPTEAVFPGLGPRRVPAADWRHADFDKWFAALAIYPRIASGGILTFIPCHDQPPLLCLDLEYVTWANSGSQAIFVDAGAAPTE